jgi:NAD(P)-dependent dehydrogenase (short-subunit alcohol dehydrogenase family)
MAMEVAQKFGDGIRVNAIAPGFFVTHQNRDVLIGPDGGYTERSRKVLAMTPMGRFGRPEELDGAVPLQRRGELRHRHRHPGGRRLQHLQRRVTTTRRPPPRNVTPS